MQDGSKTKIYVLAALAALALGLWWWLGHETGTTADGEVEAAAMGPASDDGEATPLVVPLRRSDVDPWQAPRAVVSGTVRDEQGRPIAGAQVCATLEDRDLAQTERHPPRCTTTREDGTYRLDELLGAEHHLFASARGYLPARYQSRSGIQNELSARLDLQAGITRAGVDFVLKEGGVELTGVVKDIAGGEIEGAWVSSGDQWWGNAGVAFARSDEEGRFSLWVEPPEVRVSAFADGYAEGSRGAAVPGTVLEIFLTPESVVVGKVVWADSAKPVAGAEVSASGSGFAAMFGVSAGSVYSEDDGSFRLEGLEPGSYKIHASGDALTGSSAEKVHVGLGQTSEPVVVKVHPAFSIRGAVLVDGQTPCSYGSVSLQGKDRKDARHGSGAGEEDGTVRIKGVLPGTYEVTVQCNGYVPEAEYPDLVIADASLEGLTWTVRAGQTIRGVVLDAKGQPVEGASVSARGKADEDPRARRSNAWAQRSEADGSFVVQGLLPGNYDLSVWHADFSAPHEPTTVEVPEGGDVSGITLTMLASGQIHGIVRDEKGTAVGGVSVRLTGARWGSAITNDEGRFVMQAVEVGEHRIVAQHGWSETMRAPGASDDDTAGERVEVRADEVTEVELVVESQNGRITGRVLAEGGEPVADAFVEAVRESDSAARSMGGSRSRARWGSWMRQPVLTDEDGRFVLEDLAEQGVYSVYASRKGGGEAIAEHVAAGSDVELAIAETAALAGVVRIDGGGAPQRFQVSVTDRAAGVWEQDRFLETEGAWRIANLPPGTYEVSVEAAEGNAKTEVELAEGDEQTDIELVLAPRITLHGQLVDAETGEPVAGHRVIARAAGGGFTMIRSNASKGGQKDVSDAEGRFEVEDAPTGKIMLSIAPPSFTDVEYGRTSLTRRVAPEPRVQDLGRLELVRNRLGRGEEAGDLGFKTKETEPGTEPEDVRHVVAFVRPGGPAAAAGLKVGDEIAGVGDQEVRGLDAYRFSRLTRVPPGTKVVLGVLEGETLRAVSITAGPPV